MKYHQIVPAEVDLLVCPDGTTILIRGGLRDGVAVISLYCGGDNAHCDPDGSCEHVRELLDAQDDRPDRVVELVPRWEPPAG